MLSVPAAMKEADLLQHWRSTAKRVRLACALTRDERQQLHLIMAASAVDLLRGQSMAREAGSWQGLQARICPR